jgi:uncharacterized protein YndB with AHSA1/START domain
METVEKTMLTISTTVNAPADKVWEYWNNPEHITQWGRATDDWITPRAENDLRVGGKFLYRMEAKDGSMGFDFGGVYDEVSDLQYIEYTIGDGRKVKISFTADGPSTQIVENFEPESTNPLEMQQAGWQAILDNFKKYTEAG